MNQIRAIQALNKKEIENGISPEASWHSDYRDTAFVYFGGLPYELSEGDVITIFSQFGEPVWIRLARDKETGKSKGFGWLKYEDQRSTDLAVDNLGGAEVMGRMLRVDHARYKPRKNEDVGEGKCGWEDMLRREGKLVEDTGSEDESAAEGGKGGNGGKPRETLEEERELRRLMHDGDEDDPMRDFLIAEKKKEVAEAIRRRGKEERRLQRREDRPRRERSREKRGHRDHNRKDEMSRDRYRKRHRDDGDVSRDREGDRKRHRDNDRERDAR